MSASQRWALRLARTRVQRAVTPRLQLRYVASSRTPANKKSLRNSSGHSFEAGSKRQRNDESSQQPSNDRNETKQPEPTSRVEATSDALRHATEAGENPLVAPVHIPSDPSGILRDNHPSTSLLANSTIVIQRQLEMMNVFLGFEQANKYVIMDAEGNHIGFLAEQDHGFGQAMKRQAFRTHRSFTAHVFDRSGQEVLRFHRPFAWISSRIRVYDPIAPGQLQQEQRHAQAHQGENSAVTLLTEQATMIPSSLPLEEMRIIGEAQQQWALLRRKYNLFLHREDMDSNTPQLKPGDIPLSSSTSITESPPAQGDTRSATMSQFAYVNEPFLSWDFSLKSDDEQLLGSVNRNFSGFAREIFTDTGVYALRMDSAGIAAGPGQPVSQQSGNQAALIPATDGPGMTLDQRAVMLATAVSIDFDYFSRHSGASHGGFMPFFIPWGGGAAEAGAAGGAAGGAAEAGAAGAAGGMMEGAAGSAVGNAARGAGGIGMSEGIAGAGTIAGYEAMQRGRGSGQVDDASPQAADPFAAENAPPPDSNQSESFWSEDSPWKQQGPDGSGGGGGGGGGGGDGGSFWDEFF